MCGIAGFVSQQQTGERIEAAVRRMMQAMLRRGPDSGGFEAWRGVGLGHRRLAILDLSPAGHQPMLSEDRQVGVVFNGCIYNFLELRAELETAGHAFRSHCDTEVLVRGYQQWGIDGLVQRLRGMFAFGIWDERTRTLSLVRDRLGVKPLAYKVSAEGIAFASTVGALKAGGFSGPVDPGALVEYLEYGNISGDRCVYQGVSKLAPATILEWRDGNVRERCYWTLPTWESNGSNHIGFEEAVEETERILVEATKLRLCADVPISALLSGGVDSSLVCWALSRANANVTAFTFGAGGDPSDESQQAAATAKLLGIPHQIVEAPRGGPLALDQMEDVYSEPFASQSAQGMLRISEAVKPIAKVMLTGDGGDDVFLGYPFLYNAWRAGELARSLPAPLLPVMRGVANMLPPVGILRRAKNFLGYSGGGLKAYLSAHRIRQYFVQRNMLGDSVRSLMLPDETLGVSNEAAQRLFSDVLAYQHRMHFVGEFMPKVDGATMFHSIESRAPFLDQKLWEWAASLSPQVRFQGGVLKAVLREIVRRRVSPQLANEPKRGFTVPVERWLATHWSQQLDLLLTGRTELEQLGVIRKGSLEGPVREARGRAEVPVQLWYLLVLEHWLQRQRADGAA
jgi:asparagine synthase (glutamine-hydrolysing)